MDMIETQVTEETGSMAGFRVEFFAQGGDKISVLLRQGEDLSRETAVARACALLAQLGADRGDGPESYKIQAMAKTGSDAGHDCVYRKGLLRWGEPLTPKRRSSSAALVMPIRGPITMSAPRNASAARRAAGSGLPRLPCRRSRARPSAAPGLSTAADQRDRRAARA